jgi:alkyl hydroperoxide reductase subunit AhpC
VCGQDYGVLIEEAGVALRGLFIIDKAGIVRQITINDLPVGRDVDETLRLVQVGVWVESTASKRLNPIEHAS